LWQFAKSFLGIPTPRLGDGWVNTPPSELMKPCHAFDQDIIWRIQRWAIAAPQRPR